MKIIEISILLLSMMVFIPAFAQDSSFDNQLVSSEEYTKLVDRLYQLENDRDILITKTDSLENLNVELAKEIKNLRENSKWLSIQPLAGIGIGIELIGILMMAILWGKIPRLDIYEKWIKNNSELFYSLDPREVKDQENSSFMTISNVRSTVTGTHRVILYEQVPNKFRNQRRWRTKYPTVIVVILGLILQAIPIYFSIIRF